MSDIGSLEATKGIAKAISNLLSGPINEMSELIADQIRYYRWKSLVNIAERAKELRIKKGLNKEHIPLKVLLPILEEGSKEEDTSDMCERWSQLLASVDSKYNSFDLVCVDFLKKISSLDASVIDTLGTYSDHEVFCNKLMNDVLSMNPDLSVAIENCSEKEPNFNEKDRSKYFQAVSTCLENDLKLCWDTLAASGFEEINRLRSKFVTNHPETIYALRTIGIVDNYDTYRDSICFNPDFSIRHRGRGERSRNGKWGYTDDSYSISIFRLTHIGELFWQKVNGSYSPKNKY